MTTDKPLDGYRVLEFGERIGAAYATKCLAELGADVVRVATGTSDGGFDAHLAAYLNAGKRSLAASALSADLLREADLVVTGLPPAELNRLGLTLDAIAAIAPNTLVINVTSFGLDGPYRDWLGDDAMLLALGGVMNTTGEPGRPPLATYGHLAEYQLGTNVAIAALVALYGREARGVAQSVDISGFEVGATLIENVIPLWTMGGRLRARVGNGYYATGPILDIHPCADGFYTLSAVSELQWEGLCLAMGKPDWLDDPSWGSWPLRRSRLPEIHAALDEWAASLSKTEVFAQLQALRVPSTPHYEIAELFDDPQHVARGFFVGEHNDQPALPFRIDGTRLASPEPECPADDTSVAREWSAPRRRTNHEPATPTNGPHRAPAGVLDSVRIVDLTQAWAGPLCTQILADFGAQVIRVESATHPDVFRLSELLPGDTDLYERGPFFHSANRNKLSVSLQLDTAAGREVLADLVRAADVVIDNFSARVMRNFGFGGDAVLALNPRVIAISMPAFGFDGPYANHVCYGEPMEGIGGLTALTGYIDEGPMRTGMAQVDASAAFHAGVAIMAALVRRERTGRGAAIDLSHFECCNRMLGEEIVAASTGTKQPARRGNRDPRFAPQGVYRCAGEDEWVMISIRTDAQWAAFTRLADDPAIGTESLATAAGRRAAHGTLDEAIGRWTAIREKHVVMRACQAEGIPAAAIYRPEDLVADPQLQARGFIAGVDHSLTGPEVLPGPSFRLSKTPARIASPAPLFGEQTDAVLKEVLGYDGTRIRALREAGVVGRLPVIEGHTTL